MRADDDNFNATCYNTGGLLGLFLATLGAAGLASSTTTKLKALFGAVAFGYMGLEVFDDVYDRSIDCLSGAGA